MSHSKPQTVCILGGRCAVNLRAGGHSPGDFVAVHSLAVSGENTLEGQHFVQGCMETVKRRKGKTGRRRGFIVDRPGTLWQLVTSHFTDQL